MNKRRFIVVTIVLFVLSLQLLLVAQNTMGFFITGYAGSEVFEGTSSSGSVPKKVPVPK